MRRLTVYGSWHGCWLKSATKHCHVRVHYEARTTSGFDFMLNVHAQSTSDRSQQTGLNALHNVGAQVASTCSQTLVHTQADRTPSDPLSWSITCKATVTHRAKGEDLLVGFRKEDFAKAGAKRKRETQLHEKSPRIFVKRLKVRESTHQRQERSWNWHLQVCQKSRRRTKSSACGLLPTANRPPSLSCWLLGTHCDELVGRCLKMTVYNCRWLFFIF